MAVFAFLLYFYTVMMIEKRNLAPQSPRKYAILTLESKTNFWGGGTALSPDPSPCGEGTPPKGHLWRLWRLDSTRAFGARPCSPPTSTPGSAYE